MSKVKITFAGGANTPTGSNFLLEYGDRKFLVDCGLYQGEKIVDAKNHEDFKYDPKDIDALFVTHGHLDHVGRIPKLFHDGFNGVIYSTPPTRDIGELIMLDALHLTTKEAEEDGLPPLYEERDVIRAMGKWYTQDYHEVLPIETSEGVVKVIFKDSGHILGASMIEFHIGSDKIVFTGDLGNTPSPLLRETESIEGTTHLIMESVYGDRNHEDNDIKVQKLLEVIKKVISRGGTLMIPVFSIERTQEMLYFINHFVEKDMMPKCPIYLDTPLGINITSVYKKYEKNYMNNEVNSIVNSGDDIFNFPGLIMTRDKEESKKIGDDHGAKIILAGSGMSSGGRILHHEAKYLSDAKNFLLLVGYQALGSLGRRLQDGNKKVFIHRQEVIVNAEIETISGFSAHKDSDNLTDFAGEAKDTIKNLFIVLGEPKSSIFLAQKIYEHYGIKATLPEPGETIDIEIK